MRLLHNAQSLLIVFLKSLNPYSTGNEVVAEFQEPFTLLEFSLNPYSTGNEVVAGLC